MPGLPAQQPAIDAGAEDAVLQAEQQHQREWRAMAASLSSHPGLVLPSSMYQDHQPTAQEAQDYLQGLAQRSPGAFLQRYGRLLTQPQLGSFEPLRNDYEVNHWLSHYMAPAQPSASQPGSVQGWPADSSNKTLVQNRRLAALQQLQKDGDYFSMSSMRERAPLLYHQLIGQFVGDAPPTAPDGGAQNSNGDTGIEAASDAVAHASTAGRLSESLMRQHDEVQVYLQMQQEQQQEDEQMSEQESSSDEEEAQQPANGSGRGNGPGQGPGTAAGGPAAASISTSELMEKRREFQQEMEQRFLFGQDAGFDYQVVDEDIDGKLDEHWAAQVNRDAEDAYFEDMEAGMDAGGANDLGREQQLGPGEYDY